MQLASIVKELSKISCKICYKIMNHSTAFDSFNTFIIKKHFKLNFCVAIERKREYS